MFRSTRTLAAIFAVVLPAGCFIDRGGNSGDPSATTGETDGGMGSTSTGVEISVGHSTLGTTDATTGMTATDTATSSTQGDTDSDSDPTTESQTDTNPETDTDTDTSSTTDSNTLSVEDLEPGDLIITEVMANPNCTADNCEWFEVYNATEFDIDLQNLGIGDRDDYEATMPGTVILISAILPAGELGIIAREELWPYNESVEPLARYSNTIQLSNSTFEQVAIFSGNDVLDVTASFLPNEEAGRSRALLTESWDMLDHTDSDDWCWSNTVLPSTSTSDDWGTPGTNVIDCLNPA